jgi:putative oxidoreductase
MGSTVPRFTATIAVVMELVVGMAILVGFFTRPLALLLAFYTLCTAVIGYDYSMMQGMEHYANLINLYKSISIVGALFLLCVTGPGKFSFDRK